MRDYYNLQIYVVFERPSFKEQLVDSYLHPDRFIARNEKILNESRNQDLKPGI